jgi:hypothetical protein
MPDAVRQIATTHPKVYAFEIDGEVSPAEMRAMAETMNAAFDATEGKVNLMLIFRSFERPEPGTSLDWETLTSRLRSVWKVDRYVVVGAPDGAETMIEAMGKIIPVEARTFDLSEIEAAWSHAGARPAGSPAPRRTPSTPPVAPTGLGPTSGVS